ncbi:hypothetical protein [Brevundimonas poindexterae]|uniref:hypothetical protein n=1 Tax=Brevundimonas poindexterae TaxID=74325 RepID=UPI001CFED9C2|nr:hypothetical protein [Brevundimonas poindexterae]
MARHRGSHGSRSGFADRIPQRGADDARRKQLARTLASNAQTAADAFKARPTRHQRDIAAYLDAAKRMPLYAVGDSATRDISETYLALMSAALRAMNSGQAEVILCWPSHRPCLSALVALLSIAETAAGPRRQVVIQGANGAVAAAPEGIRAVLYPYARTAHTSAREVHVDRNALSKLHLEHFLRSSEAEDDPGLKDYHQVLVRAKSITGRGRDGIDHVELIHPILDEIVPHGSAREGSPATGQLLWHTKAKTDLKQHTRSGAADRPDSAKFFLFGVGANDPIEREMKALKRSPDVVILDLSKGGRSRLGFDWLETAAKALATIKTAYPDAGVLALTDDPWTYDAARLDLLGRKLPGRRGAIVPANAQTVLTRTDGILSPLVAEGATLWRGAEEIQVDGFVGSANEVIARFRSLGAQLRERGNRLGADAARDIIAKVRRAACLPGSLAQFSNFLEQEAGETIAADHLAAYRIDAEINVLLDVRNGASLVAADELQSAIRAARDLLRKAQSATPMSTLVEEAVLPAERASSLTVVLFRTEVMADFCAFLLGRDHPKLKERLERGIVRFTTKQGFDDLAKLGPSVKNHYKRAIVVAPTRQTILELLAQPWLPDAFTVLADGDTLKFSARDALRLADQIPDPELVRRLEVFAANATARLRGLGDHQVDLDRTVAPAEDVEFPSSQVIDLSGSGRRGDRSLLELVMENGQRVIAHPGTILVGKDSGRSVSRFVEVEARELQGGEEICVIGPAFIEKARGLLNLTATAAEEIRDYHQLVLEKFGALSGDPATRLRELCARMGEPAISTQRAHYWINLEAEAHKPLYEVIPHAPQDEATFRRFTAALGIGPQMTARFWTWAVIAQRSSRVRAGSAFHDAYRGILTDVHAATAENKERARDIRALRAAAEEFVTRVAAVRPWSER